MLLAPLPEIALAHKRCGPIPLTALLLTPPVNVITTSLPHHNLVPLRHDKTSHLDDVIRPKAPKSPMKAKFCQIVEKVSFSPVFICFFFVKLFHANYVQATARAYSLPPGQTESSVLLCSSSVNLQLHWSPPKYRYLPRFTSRTCNLIFPL